MNAPRAIRSPGFTMIEVLAVLLVTSLLLGATITFYIDLSRQATRATENTREVRRAAALVDRIAEDLQHTMLVKKPAEADVLGQPWLFVAESRHSQSGTQPGSDHLKFIRTEIPRASDGPASVVERVAYTLDRSEEADHYVLRRWSAPELGDGLDRDFPSSDDPASLVVADDVSYFALRFMGGDGEWLPRWDSTLIAESSQLPLAVEIEVALAPPAGLTDADPDAPALEPLHYARQVDLPLRPIDLEELLNPKEKEEEVAKKDDEKDGQRTIGECVDVSKIGVSAPGVSESDLAALAAAIQNNAGMPFTKSMAEQYGSLAAINPDCL
jgi:prepilin-type N-terminal cleavage/methylation domain-containing protein